MSQASRSRFIRWFPAEFESLDFPKVRFWPNPAVRKTQCMARILPLKNQEI
jgi:hypothetical protein